MCEEGVASDTDFAEVVGSVFSTELSGVVGVLDSMEGFLSLGADSALPSDRKKSIQSIEKAFTTLLGKQSMIIDEACRKVGEMVVFKSAGLDLAKKIDNVRLLELGRKTHEMTVRFNSLLTIDRMADSFIRHSSCRKASGELASRLKGCMRDWLELADKVEAEMIALQNEVNITEEKRRECAARVQLLNKRALVLAATGTALGLVAVTAGAAAPVLAGGATGVAIAVGGVCGFSCVARAGVVKLMRKLRQQGKHCEATLGAATSIAEGFAKTGIFLEEVANIVDDGTEQRGEMVDLVRPVLVQPEGGSLISITDCYSEGMDATAVIGFFERLVGQDCWSRQCAAQEGEVVKLIEVRNAVYDYMCAADHAQINFRPLKGIARMTE